MGGFNNSILGGVGALIRQYIQSPNYVAGTSGWTINRDGSAEFNAGTFRGNITTSGDVLLYSPAPGAGTLKFAFSAAGGADAYGNTYPAGISFATVAAANLAGILSWGINELVGHTAGYIAGIRDVGGFFRLELAGEDGNDYVRIGSHIDGAGDAGVLLHSAGGKVIADALNGVMLGVNSNPIRQLEFDSFTSSFAGVNSTNGTVTFATAFPVGVIPNVQATPLVGANNDLLFNCQNVSNTQFAWRLAQKSGVNITTTATVFWEAKA